MNGVSSQYGVVSASTCLITVKQQQRLGYLLYDHHIQQPIRQYRLGCNGKIVAKLIAVGNTYEREGAPR